jgi:hypothetical protein
MTWIEHLPKLTDDQNRVGEAMGGLADDEYGPPSPAMIATFTADLDDYDRVHEAMAGICQADEP